jgi:uncharacterized membrane protein YphA (DoxX/SURF4 family)
MGIQHSDRGVALLRIVVGFWFLKAGFSHLAWNPMPWVSPRWLEIMPKIVAEHASKNPIPFVQTFLEQMVLPRAELFAAMSSLGEFAVGVSLLLGLFAVLGGLGGLLLVLVYGAMTIYSPSSQGFHLVLLAAMIIFIVTRPGRLWGIDMLLARIMPRSPLW